MIKSFVELETKVVDGSSKVFTFVRNYSDGVLTSEYNISDRPLGVSKGVKYYDITGDGLGGSTKVSKHLADAEPSQMWCSTNFFAGGITSHEITPKKVKSEGKSSEKKISKKEESLKIDSALKKVELIERYKKIHSMTEEDYLQEVLEGSDWRSYLTDEMWDEIKVHYLEVISEMIKRSKKSLEDSLFNEIINN